MKIKVRSTIALALFVGLAISSLVQARQIGEMRGPTGQSTPILADSPTPVSVPTHATQITSTQRKISPSASISMRGPTGIVAPYTPAAPVRVSIEPVQQTHAVPALKVSTEPVIAQMRTPTGQFVELYAKDLPASQKPDLAISGASYAAKSPLDTIESSYAGTESVARETSVINDLRAAVQNRPEACRKHCEAVIDQYEQSAARLPMMRIGSGPAYRVGNQTGQGGPAVCTEQPCKM